MEQKKHVSFNVQIFHFFPIHSTQAYLGDIAGSVPYHHDKTNIAIKQVFGFPVHIKLCLHSTINFAIALCLKKQCTYLN